MDFKNKNKNKNLPSKKMFKNKVQASMHMIVFFVFKVSIVTNFLFIGFNRKLFLLLFTVHNYLRRGVIYANFVNVFQTVKIKTHKPSLC